MRYALGIEYDGKNYCGWQRQNNVITVQEKLEKALSIIADESIAVVCAGRTDTGVNATNQVIHFDTVKKYVINKLTKLNKDSIEKVKRIDEKIHKLQKTIKEEKSTTNTILKRHPFIKKLKEIQNRS